MDGLLQKTLKLDPIMNADFASKLFDLILLGMFVDLHLKVINKMFCAEII